VDGYHQYCPIARGAEVFATRWTPLIVRNMLRGSRTFTEIRAGAPGISKTLLAERLRMLEHYGVIERTPIDERRSSYVLTGTGRALAPSATHSAVGASAG
jgi:DNA-binding HxlR family transcriptional regulator